MARVDEFRRNVDGSASVEWMVAVAIVVMIAVPVMALISDGSEITSDEIVVSIQDSEPAAGAGIDVSGGREFFRDPNASEKTPGHDMGVGFPDPDTADGGLDGFGGKAVVITDATPDIRRDKPELRRLGGSADVVITRTQGGPRALPAAPRMPESALALKAGYCEPEDQIVVKADASMSDEQPRRVSVITSGR